MEVIEMNAVFKGDSEKFEKLISEASHVVVTLGSGASSEKLLGQTVLIHEGLIQAHNCLKRMQDVELETNHKNDQPMHEYWKNKVEQDVIKTVILQQLEVITNKNNNTLTHMYVFRILDLIMKNKWYSI